MSGFGAHPAWLAVENDIVARRRSLDITTINRQYYEALWAKARLQRPERFNTWPVVSALLPSAAARLELGPGLRPRLPIEGTHFIDLSPIVTDRLNARGGIARSGDLGTLPFEDSQFDLVCAFDVIEHVEDDARLFRELSRVLKAGGHLMFSVPVHGDRWTTFDDWVGHARRYEPRDLSTLVATQQLHIEKSAVFGMVPSNQDFVKRGMWWIERHRTFAMFWFNWVGWPLALLFQKPLQFVDGLIDTAGVDEMILICRKGQRA